MTTPAQDPKPRSLLGPPPVPTASPELSPNDHVKLIVQALRPANPELARRWLAALLAVPADEREAVVEAVETQIVSTYGGQAAPEEREIRVVSAPEQREGYVETVERTFTVREAKPVHKAVQRRAGKAAG